MQTNYVGVLHGHDNKLIDGFIRHLSDCNKRNLVANHAHCFVDRERSLATRIQPISIEMTRDQIRTLIDYILPGGREHQLLLV